GTECYRVTFSQCPKANTKHIKPLRHQNSLLKKVTICFQFFLLKRLKGSEEYEPIVTVSTSHSPFPGRGVGGEVVIKVADNGNGIPQKVVDKIFQPFFTTKPTGEGTGLGLSITYDIVKAHGGELKVVTKEGKGSEFIIQLPIKTI
ncbi:MAG TPA: HAMP domain-containing sensor histidine kinase, partial [Hanamia sp.]|nr:HAMP domain-containing sensor histidine kinase [Hanamia sp.]